MASITKQKPSNLDKSLSKGKAEVNVATFALLFSEIVQYCQNRVYSVSELQNKQISDMSVKIRILKALDFFKNNEDTLCPFQNFVKLLKDNYDRKKDFLREIRNANISRELKEEIKTLDNKEFVTLSGIVHYCYNHRKSLSFCQKVVNEINFAIVGKGVVDFPEDTIRSCQDLYNTIANYKLKHKVIEEVLQEVVSFNEDDIRYIVKDYKEQYSVSQWKKICAFELHFERYSVAEEYEELLQEKWKFWNEICQIGRLNASLLKQCKQTIERRNERKEIAASDSIIKLLVDGKEHRASKVDDDLFNHCLELNIDTIKSVTSFDCSEQCKQHKNGIHVIAELNDGYTDHHYLEDISVILRGCLRRKHLAFCPSISFVKPTSLQHYKTSENVNRFTLRDDYLQGKIIKDTEYTSVIECEEYDEEVTECPTCAVTYKTSPLHWKTFSVLQEWQLDVPIGFQCLLELFINKNSLKKSKDVKEVIQQKITSLYSTFDILLNTLNRTYIGILQQQNTEELILHYRSIGSVFDITSQSGATLSLKEAERQLKERAKPELCYYNTYLRRYPFEYVTASGDKAQSVSVRDCLLILMLDNLVRLRYHSDPNPGESRSSQICTLPITIKGLPRDSSDTLKWHDAVTCAGQNDNCICYKRRKLEVSEGKEFVHMLQEKESQILDAFRKLMRWTIVERWTDVKIEPCFKDILPTFSENYNESAPKDCIDDLETSLMSLGLKDHDDTFSDLDVSLQSINMESDQEEIDKEECYFEMLSPIQMEQVMQCHSNEDTNDEENEQMNEENFDLMQLLNEHVEIEVEKAQFTLEIEKRDMNDLKDVYFDVGEETLLKENISTKESSLVEELGFKIYRPPSLICRHPPPETGRDDDEAKLKAILDDILVKSGNVNEYSDGMERILFAPDHKIGKNLFSLMSKHKRYQKFLPEFPVLHLRKSKICNVLSGYKNAGLLHILKYMRDDNSDEWSKLLSERCIDDATNVIWRISLSLHIAFLIRFIQYLKDDLVENFMKDLDQKNYSSLLSFWDEKYEKFMSEGMKENATFTLHTEMMNHCDEILAVSFSERLGGEDGYNLLLGAVKSSLPFAFLNGATSYASYSTMLIHEHYTAGIFHQKFKTTLYTTPHKHSSVNFGLDSQREMDHKDVIKSFRSGSSLAAIIPRMSVIDDLNDAHDKRRDNTTPDTEQLPFCCISNTDLKHVIPTAELILRRKGLEIETNIIPYNVYAKKHLMLSTAILDKETYDLGHYLIQKYVASEELFGQRKENVPNLSEVTGPSQLMKRVKTMKGTVVNRTRFKLSTTDKTERDIAEEARQKKVDRINKRLDRLSSNMNACQAILKPDCSKPKVMKAAGIQQALLSLLVYIQKDADITFENISLITPKQNELEKLSQSGLIHLKSKSHLPFHIGQFVKLTTIEFAGAKFKCKAPSGSGYLNFVENSILKPIISMVPSSTRIVVCEEKYSYTPDDFKAATREQRKKKDAASITHLKVGDYITQDAIDKEAIVSTQEGKIQISTFLAKNAHRLNIKKDIYIDFDSELKVAGCVCTNTEQGCSCKTHAVPLRCQFTERTGFKESIYLYNVKQRKGEAEMSQVDWLIESLNGLKEGDAALSVVTSGDIDSIIIHMFILPLLLPRNEYGKFKNTIYVMLQKPGKVYDLYNITAILDQLERTSLGRYAGIKIALILCLGGNDYLPKYHNISHKKFLETFLKQPNIRNGLFSIAEDEESKVSVNGSLYKDLFKTLYCPKKLDPSKLTLEEVRQMTIHKTSKQDKTVVRNAQLWMPPVSAIEQLLRLFECQVKYLLTVGYPYADMPDFLTEGCLRKSESGEIEYDLGPDVYVGDIETMFNLPGTGNEHDTNDRKRKQKQTPQKGRRRKLTMTSTPKLAEMGQHVGSHLLDLLFVREKGYKREIKLLNMLLFIKNNFWKTLFGKEADRLEHSNDDERTYYIIESEHLVNKFISVPKDKGKLNCAAFTAGIIEAVLNGANFPAKVTAHWHKGTTFMIEFDDSVIARDKVVEGK